MGGEWLIIRISGFDVAMRRALAFLGKEKKNRILWDISIQYLVLVLTGSTIWEHTRLEATDWEGITVYDIGKS